MQQQKCLGTVLRLFKIYVLVTNCEEDAVTNNASFLPRDSFTSAYFSVHYSLYKQRNLINIFLLSVLFNKGKYRREFDPRYFPS